MREEYNIGYEHRFSKRTNIGIGYAKIDNKQNAQFTLDAALRQPDRVRCWRAGEHAAVRASDVSTFFISMTHRF